MLKIVGVLFQRVIFPQASMIYVQAITLTLYPKVIGGYYKICTEKLLKPDNQYH